MSRPPVVTVIIPVYNAERHLEETLDSVFAQTLRGDELEVIAVNDGSTDGSLAILERYREQHPSMQVHSIPNSGSAAHPRNVGLDHATGRFVFFLDADDLLAPDALRAAAQLADASGSGVVLIKVAPIGVRPVQRGVFSRTQKAVDFVESGAYHGLGPGKLFRRSILEEHHLRFSYGFRMGEDRPLVMAAFLHSPHVSVLADEVYYHVRAHPDGSNVSSHGQEPRHHLEANLALAEVVVDGTTPGARRETLLARPIVGPGGLRATFGKAFVTMTEEEQDSAIERARTFLEAVWTPGLRARGLPEEQVLCELVLRGDRAALVAASQTLAEGRRLPITAGERGFAYADGDVVVEALDVKAGVTLEGISVSKDAVAVTAVAKAEGLRIAPDTARVVWTHRGTGRTVTVEAAEAGADGRIRVVTPFRSFAERGRWNATVEVRWGGVTVRDPEGAALAALEGRPAVVRTASGAIQVEVPAVVPARAALATRLRRLTKRGALVRAVRRRLPLALRRRLS